MIVTILLIIYFIVFVMVYIALGFLIDLNKGIDNEFDMLMQDNSVKMLALFIVSLIWPISIPIIIINNILN